MIITTLQKIQSELKAPKNQYNSFGGYNYRNCEDILEALKPILAKYSAAVTLTDSIEEIGGKIYVKATATLTANNDKNAIEEMSVSAFAREAEIKKGMDCGQLTGAASSYARKYALNGLFAIDDTKDPDTPPAGTQPVSGKEKKPGQDPHTAELEYLSGECHRIAGEIAKITSSKRSFVEKVSLQECGVKGTSVEDLKKVKAYLEIKLNELSRT